MHDVFISYSTTDLDKTEMVRQVLETNGISCWIAPRNIPGGSNYAQEIPNAIRNCRIFLLILSPRSQSSVWVRRELDLAVKLEKYVIPFMIENFQIEDIFDFYLTGYQRYDAYQKTTEAAQMLVKQLHSMLDNNRQSTNSLRYDGYYYTPKQGGQHSYFRFFPDGIVVSASSSGDPVAVSDWLNHDYVSQTVFTRKGNSIDFIIPVIHPHTIHYHGTVQDSKITLTGFSTYAQRNFEYPCSFISLEEIERQRTNPKPKIMQVSTIDASKDPMLDKAGIRFDGLYFTAPERGSRTYYRFYSDGRMVYSLTSGTPAQVTKWLSLEREDNGSRAAFDGKQLIIEQQISGGHVYRAKGTVQGNMLTMYGFNTYSQREYEKKCTFLSFEEIMK